MNLLMALIIISIIFTGGIMFTGAISMTKGGDFNKKNGNKLMRYRVLAQFVTIVLIVLYLYLYT